MAKLADGRPATAKSGDSRPHLAASVLGWQTTPSGRAAKDPATVDPPLPSHKHPRPAMDNGVEQPNLIWLPIAISGAARWPAMAGCGRIGPCGQRSRSGRGQFPTPLPRTPPPSVDDGDKEPGQI